MLSHKVLQSQVSSISTIAGSMMTNPRLEGHLLTMALIIIPAEPFENELYTTFQGIWAQFGRSLQEALSADLPSTIQRRSMSAIYLIRHGQASFGSANYDELSPIGRTQARLLGEALRAWELRFDMAYSGSMRRQHDTATLAFGAPDSSPLTADFRQHPAFNEFDHESLIRNHWRAVTDQDFAPEQMTKNRTDSRKSFQRIFEQIMGRWTSGRSPIPGEETWAAFNARVNAGLDDIIQRLEPSHNVAVFTSGGPIAAILKRVLRLSSDTTLRLNWRIANCSVTKLHYDGRGTHLAFFNNYAHLQVGGPENRVTYR